MTKIEEMIAELCPNGVEWKELGEVSSFYGGLTGKNKSDFENGNAKYVTYKNIFSNIQVDPSLLETVSVTSGEKQNSIEYGDILITGSSESKEESGMSSAVTFYPDNKIYLNSFSFGIRFNSDFELLPEFSKYLFRSYTFRKQIEKTASGVTRYNISKVAFKKIKVPVLPKKIQEEIVQILDKFTEYVTELTAELTDRQKQYSFYRDKLLSFEDEVYQVEWKTLKDVARVITSGGTPDRSMNSYYGGTIPWLRTQEVNFRDIYSTELTITEEGLANSSAKWIVENSVIIAMYGATAGKVGIAKIPMTTNQACCNIEVDEDLASYRYVYHWLSYNYETLKGMGQGSQSNLNAGMIKSFKIPIPPLPIQERIVQVLDNFDAVCNDLSIGLPKEIELRQKQYEYFREKLLTFTAEGVYPGQWTVDSERGPSDLISLLQWVFGTIQVELGAIATVQRGASPRPISSYLTGDKDGIPWIKIGDTLSNSKYITSTEQKISQVGAKKSRLLKKGDFILSNSMSYGRPYILQIDGAIHDGWASISDFEETINPDFLYQYLSSQRVQSYWDSKINSGSVSNLNSGIIKSLEINLPSLSTQKRIVAILDKFDELTTSISQGLPKEIELRQKQYEYFRDQLLNFL
ncbi:TPA: restriction endonuclease subunit S [Streptococcus suis]